MLDSDLVRASRLLTSGNPLDALSRLGGRGDPHATAIRGIALAQLGEFRRARVSLQSALRSFRRARQPLWIAKAQAALAEIDFATRDLVGAARRLDSRLLRALGDEESAFYVDLQRARLLGLLGRHGEAGRILGRASWGPAAVLARAELLARHGKFGAAARVASGVGEENPLLRGEAVRLREALLHPRFRFRRRDKDREMSLVEIERLPPPYLDLIRRRFGMVDLRRRPAALELLAALARGPVTARRLYPAANESHEDRLKVEIARLRKAGVRIRKTQRGYETDPFGVLLPGSDPVEGLLSDGEAWPPRSIAAVLGVTVRSVERQLRDDNRFRAEGRGRARRYRRIRRPGIATQMFLLARTKTS